MLSLKPKYKAIQLAFVCISIIAMTFIGCNSQKRVNKALMKLNQEELGQLRPWPHNYTFFEYSDLLDEARHKEVFLKTRKKQAKKADDKRMELVMEKNIELNDQNIKRLKADKKFYKVYKLRYREVSLKLKAEKKALHKVEKQKKKQEKERHQRRDESREKRKEREKKQEKMTDAKLDKLEAKQEIIEDKDEVLEDAIKDKEKEIASLKKEQTKAPDEDKGYYDDEIDFINQEIETITEKKAETQFSLDSMNIIIDKFKSMHYGSDTTSTVDTNSEPLPFSVGTTNDTSKKKKNKRK